ncbi:sigma-70 family RNA polymerase sigma factor [soil metagenome]
MMTRYCEGDAQAFRELYALVSPRLFGYLVKISRERVLASDLLQLTFLKVHRARAAYIRGADPLPWIYAIAHRTFIDEVRKRQRDAVRLGNDVDPEQAPAPDADDRGNDAADSELITAALSALSRLSDEQRQAVVLTKLEGKTLAEAAEIAGTSVGAMKVRAHRGYKALRNILGHREPSASVAVFGGPP